MSGKLKEIWDEEESSRAAGGKAPFQQRCHIVLDAVSGDNEWFGFAGAI